MTFLSAICLTCNPTLCVIWVQWSNTQQKLKSRIGTYLDLTKPVSGPGYETFFGGNLDFPKIKK